jgi:tRNA-specific 2-thiouridylase
MDKKDSTGICFIGERNFRDFLKNYIPAQDGNIIDIETGRKVGTHCGAMYYTIGQRKGLGIGGIKGEQAKGWFIVKKDVKKNILYVASRDENDYLYSDSCLVKTLNWITDTPKEGQHLNAKFRYRQQDNGVTIHFVDKYTIRLVFDEPYKAVTPGQAAVIYDGEICLGGGLIDKVFKGDKEIH